jgi:uncharacterized protein YgiM (DUF1202 family)
MKKALVVAVMVVVTAFCVNAQAQTEYYVQSMKAKVMSGKSFQSAVLGEVYKGFKFDGAAKEGRWMKVTYKKTVGYVPSLLLSTHPPFQRTRVIKADDREIKQGVRRRASSYTSAAAARGLAQDDRRRMNREERADYVSLEKMERFQVSQDEVNRFMEGEK